VTTDELIIPLQILITKHEKWEKYRSAKKQNNSGKRVIKHNGIHSRNQQRRKMDNQRGRGGEEVTIHQKKEEIFRQGT